MKDIVRMSNIARAAVLWLAVTSQTARSEPLDACTVLSADEIKAALGRTELGAARPSRASGGYSDCRFPGSGAGDVRITLTPAMASAQEDFALQPEILAAEGKTFQALTGIGDGAYYWSDSIQFRVGDRIVSLWIDRTPRTEAPGSVKGALTGLARRATERLNAAR